MSARFLRAVQRLDLEERILNVACLAGTIGVFLPWLSRELEGQIVVFAGYQYLTGLLGLAVLLLTLFVLAVTIVPLCGGPELLRHRYLHITRFIITAEASVLSLSALAVLLRTSFEFYRTEVRFGAYVTLAGCAVATLYAFLLWQQQRKSEAQSVFHHPESDVPLPERKEARFASPPPPPPPPPLPPEEHHVHRQPLFPNV
ncbi:MAG: hypothetical protein G01um101425_499 [Candidatus Peregrinibacteria bacterium Gr01-1014_25]|nr:MAG: hypothetical protein G01um101425_499 [Candidatus Peregrinibacteria bacterium Gr01-1014_25]